MNHKITVFTSTYNRKHLLNRLYKSLKRQSYREFEWIIYDDGSNDGTCDLIDLYKNESIINIKYIYSLNRGKHVGINKGVEVASGDLFFIVDSDDYLPEDSLKIINDTWNSIEDKESFMGLGGLKEFINKKNSKFNFIDKYYDCNTIDFNLKEGNIQDKAEVFATTVLKKYKFPEFKGENFITEAVVWYKLSEEKYICRWINEVLYVAEYYDDGLTKNFYRKRIDNILGTCYSYDILSSYNLPIKYKIRYKINYFRYGLSKFSAMNLIKKLNNRNYIIIGLSVGYFLRVLDKVKYDNKASN